MALEWKPILHWTPRILALLFAVFLSLFALDVFGEGYGFWKTILALVMHLIPTGIVLAVLAVSWRWQWLGAASVRGDGDLVSRRNLGQVPLVGLRPDLGSAFSGRPPLSRRLDLPAPVAAELSVLFGCLTGTRICRQ